MPIAQAIEKKSIIFWGIIEKNIPSFFQTESPQNTF